MDSDRDEDGEDDYDARPDPGAVRRPQRLLAAAFLHPRRRGSPSSGCASGCSPAATRRRRWPRPPPRRRWRRSTNGRELPAGGVRQHLARPDAEEDGDANAAASARRPRALTGARPPTRGYPTASPSPTPSASASVAGQGPALRACGHRAQPVHRPAELRPGRVAEVRRLRGVDLVRRLHAQLRAGLGAGGGDQARAGGVGLGRVQAAGRRRRAVHPRRSAGALDHLEPPGRAGPRGARARCRPAPRARSTRSR